MDKLIFDHCRFSVYGSEQDVPGGRYVRAWIEKNAVLLGVDGVERLIRALLTWLVGEDTISDQLMKDLREIEVSHDKNT